MVESWDLKCFGVGKSCQPGKGMRCDIIKTDILNIADILIN